MTSGAKLTKSEKAALQDLKELGAKALRSRGTQRVISSLMDKGLIEFDISEGATITPAGRSALASRGKS